MGDKQVSDISEGGFKLYFLSQSLVYSLPFMGAACHQNKQTSCPSLVLLLK